MDKLNIEILEDGTISVKTDKISKTNHHSADHFLADMVKLCGGEKETKNRNGKNLAGIHTHKHTHNHN